MNSLFNSEDGNEEGSFQGRRDQRDQEDRSEGRDREISLGTSVVLGLFFALAIVCALFFGFGYTLGRHSAVTLAASSATAAPHSASTAPKPSGSFINSNATESQTPANAPNVPFSHAAEAGLSPTPKPSARVKTESPAPSAPPTATLKALSRPAATPPGPALPAALGPSQPVVQIAAVSHQEDADSLVSSLKRRGYSVAIFHEPQDKLLHVQIGPFADRKEADAMRLRLLAEGFNAIVK